MTFFFSYIKTSRIFTFQKYNKVVEEEPGMLECIPDHFKTQETFETSIGRCLFALTLAPDQYKKQQIFKTVFLSERS